MNPHNEQSPDLRKTHRVPQRYWAYLVVAVLLTGLVASLGLNWVAKRLNRYCQGFVYKGEYLSGNLVCLGEKPWPWTEVNYSMMSINVDQLVQNGESIEVYLHERWHPVGQLSDETLSKVGFKPLGDEPGKWRMAADVSGTPFEIQFVCQEGRVLSMFFYSVESNASYQSLSPKREKFRVNGKQLFVPCPQFLVVAAVGDGKLTVKNLDIDSR